MRQVLITSGIIIFLLSGSYAQTGKRTETPTEGLVGRSELVAEERLATGNQSAESQRRLLRDKAHNTPAGQPIFRLDESSPVVVESGWPAHLPAEPALPVRGSSLIILGQVQKAGTFLSDDNSSLYSEFAVVVQEIYKTSVLPVVVGAPIDIQRAGGALRLKTGKILYRDVIGKNYPKLGATYIFFLSDTDDRSVFSLITAYEVRGGEIVPLDGSAEHPSLKRFANYTKLAHTTVAKFVDDLQTEIKSSEVRQ